MASHHHHHPHLQANSYCSSCLCSQCCHPSPPPPPPQPQSSDHLLQALASLLLQTQPQPQPQSQQDHYLSQTHILKTLQDRSFSSKKHHFHQKHQHLQEPNFVLSSLLSRISALESSLHHFSSTSNSQCHSSYPLKDAAARVIQTHFRAFLVHRSRTLRQLKDLAFVKSSLNSLKHSILNKTRFDYEAVSQKAMKLLLKLDSFQGGDPMVRDGKRSVSKDLVQFLEYIDGLALKRYTHLYNAAKNGRVLGDVGKVRTMRSKSGETIKKLSDRVEKLERFSINGEGDEDDNVELEGFHQAIDEEIPRISINGTGGLSAIQNKNGGIQPRVKKSVSFAENGNVYRIISRGNEVSSSGDGSLSDESLSSDDNREVVENLGKEIAGLAENEEDLNLDNEESLQNFVGEKNSRVENSSRNAGIGIDGDYRIEGGDFVFSAPLPVKMESKADIMKKRKGGLKIVW